MSSLSDRHQHDIESVWSVLESRSAPAFGQITAAPIGLHVEAGDVAAGIDEESNRHVLIPLFEDENLTPHISSDAARLVLLDRGQHRYVSLVCLNQALQNVFAKMVRQILLSLPSSGAVGEHVAQIFTDWAQLFANAGDPTMSWRAQVGLFGELLLVRDLIDFDAHDPMHVWKGPEGHQHDFRAANVAVEVKTSTIREGRRARINGVHQLEAPAESDLFVVHFLLEEDPAGQRLDDLVSGVGDRLEWPSDYRSKLHKVGYRLGPAHSSPMQYRVVDRRWYDVETNAFPRIVPSSFAGGTVPPGTMKISYVIDLSNEPPHPLGGLEVAPILRRLCS